MRLRATEQSSCYYITADCVTDTNVCMYVIYYGFVKSMKKYFHIIGVHIFLRNNVSGVLKHIMIMTQLFSYCSLGLEGGGGGKYILYS